MGVSRHCIALLGGTFDPVHNGHLALAQDFIDLIKPDVLRLIPAGNPWQKSGVRVSGEHRVEMLRRAFVDITIPAVIDQQEILRDKPTYTIETLRNIREEAGPDASLVFLLGADQLQKLDTWEQWQQLFDYAHFCIASRPGYAMHASEIPACVMQAIEQRRGSLQQIREQTSGRTYLASNLNVDISSTEIRAVLQRHEAPSALMPSTVLDYIKLHHLYQS